MEWAQPSFFNLTGQYQKEEGIPLRRGDGHGGEGTGKGELHLVAVGVFEGVEEVFVVEADLDVVPLLVGDEFVLHLAQGGLAEDADRRVLKGDLEGVLKRSLMMMDALSTLSMKVRVATVTTVLEDLGMEFL